MTENEIAEIVFKAGLQVHRNLGPGLLESAYEACLIYELEKYDIDIECQKGLPLYYDEVRLDVGYRLDLIINNKVIVEIKAVSELAGIHKAQILTYLKLTDCKLGLLINFNSELFKTGFKRVINGRLDLLENKSFDYKSL